MNRLQQLGMKRSWLYEVVISCYDNHLPHTAPFGIRSSDLKRVTIEMYEGSNTLRNILAHKDFALNLVDDSLFFYQALYDRETINFHPAEMIKAPVMIDSPSTIEVRLINAVSKKQLYLIEAEVVHVQVRHKSELTNRAKSLVLESLILSTRLSLFPEQKLNKLIKENYRVIKKVAPGSRYETIMQEVLTQCGL